MAVKRVCVCVCVCVLCEDEARFDDVLADDTQRGGRAGARGHYRKEARTARSCTVTVYTAL